jgi:hypothetical protein
MNRVATTAPPVPDRIEMMVELIDDAAHGEAPPALRSLPRRRAAETPPGAAPYGVIWYECGPGHAPRLPLTWYECGWWYERRFRDRGQAEAFAEQVSCQKRTEARLLVAGQWGATWLLGDPMLQ